MSRPSANDIATGALPKISHGRGVYLWDTEGRQYIDGSGGPAVFSVGHGDPRVNAAVAAQMVWATSEVPSSRKSLTVRRSAAAPADEL